MMEKLTNFVFNPSASTILHIDLNSCFATIEQQADPFLRGKPIAVAAYNSPRGCILAPSVEAKIRGVKTGMRVQEGKLHCPELIIKEPDPNKYRDVHLKLRSLLSEYSAEITPKSIDEFVLDFEGAPSYRRGLFNVGGEIKHRIKREIGDWLTVSMGIAPNRYLAKIAAGLKKPDGLEEINLDNYEKVYHSMELMDLCGIKRQNCIRLQNQKIFTVWDFFNTSVEKLKRAFESIVGHIWYQRLHGFEADNVVFGRHSYGNSFAMPKGLITPEELAPILQKLVEKTGRRMRKAGFHCRGVHLAVSYRDGSFWHHGMALSETIFDSRDIYSVAFKMLCHSPFRKPVAILAESCFNLEKVYSLQTSLFEDIEKKHRVVAAMDKINDRWGDFVITPATMIPSSGLVPDRIAFGGVKELEEIAMG